MARLPKAVATMSLIHVAVVVFQRPDEAAPRADHPRHRVIDERVEVGEAQPFKLHLVGGLILLLEDPFELSVVDLEMVSLVENHKSCR
mgnify:CR=1 FL=1